MPVYEFYCNDCHTIFNFLSRRVNTEKRPDCPRCGRPGTGAAGLALRRIEKIGRNPEEPVPGMPDMDDEKLERAMMSLAGEMEGVDENDPRAMARLHEEAFPGHRSERTWGRWRRRFSRLEAGADPEQLEEEMGDLFDDDNMENLFSKEGIKGLRAEVRAACPRRHAPRALMIPAGDAPSVASLQD